MKTLQIAKKSKQIQSPARISRAAFELIQLTNTLIDVLPDKAYDTFMQKLHKIEYDAERMIHRH